MSVNCYHSQPANFRKRTGCLAESEVKEGKREGESERERERKRERERERAVLSKKK